MAAISNTAFAEAAPKAAEVAELFARGSTYAEIATELGMSPGMVAVHLRRARDAGVDLPSRKSRAWTTNDDAHAIDLLQAGRSVPEAAATLERTTNALEKRLRAQRPHPDPARDALLARALAPGRRRWTPAQDQRLAERYASGATLQQLADHFGASSDAVFARIGELRSAGAELPARRPRWTEQSRERLARRYREGATYRQLSFEFGRTHGTISRQLRRLRDQGVDLERHPPRDPAAELP